MAGIVVAIALVVQPAPVAIGSRQGDSRQAELQQAGSPQGESPQAESQQGESQQAPEVATRMERWVTRQGDACAGLTVTWEVPPESLEDLVGAAWNPAPGEDGQATLDLFGVRCEGSTIEGVPTGPFALAALVTDVQAAEGTPEAWPAPPRAAIPALVGMGGHPVVELFRRHGFQVLEGDVELHVEPASSGARAGLRIAVPGGRITVQAHLEPETAPFEAGGASLVATTPGVVAGFTGPESATRRSTGTAAVTTSGDTWLSRLELGPTPDALALDTRFVWSFDFWSREPGSR